MNELQVNNLLARMEALNARADAVSASTKLDLPGADKAEEASGGNFASVFQQAVDHVNQQQQKAGQLGQAFELGDKNVSLPEVMLEMNKASVAFQTLVEVRNQALRAYRDVMSMPI